MKSKFYKSMCFLCHQYFCKIWNPNHWSWAQAFSAFTYMVRRVATHYFSTGRSFLGLPKPRQDLSSPQMVGNGVSLRSRRKQFLLYAVFNLVLLDTYISSISHVLFQEINQKIFFWPFFSFLTFVNNKIRILLTLNRFSHLVFFNEVEMGFSKWFLFLSSPRELIQISEWTSTIMPVSFILVLWPSRRNREPPENKHRLFARINLNAVTTIGN